MSTIGLQYQLILIVLSVSIEPVHDLDLDTVKQYL